MGIMGFIVLTVILAIAFKLFIVNAVIAVEKIKAYFERQNLTYVRHEAMNKPYNANFEIEEHAFAWVYFNKRYYQIDAVDIKGNPINISAIYYQSHSLLHQNKVYYTIGNA